MKEDLPIKNDIVIPGGELKITASRSSGPGGQNVNKTSTRVTIRWNVFKTTALTEEQKDRVLHRLQSELTNEGDIIIHNSASRSQDQNKKMALENLAQKIRKALQVPKKRMETRVSNVVKAIRVKEKKQHGMVKKMRSKKISFDD